MTCNTISNQYSPQSSTSTLRLCHEDRTPEINNSISKAFEKLTRYNKSDWGFNGANQYEIGGVKEHKLMKKTYLLGIARN